MPSKDFPAYLCFRVNDYLRSARMPSSMAGRSAPLDWAQVDPTAYGSSLVTQLSVKDHGLRAPPRFPGQLMTVPRHMKKAEPVAYELGPHKSHPSRHLYCGHLKVPDE